MLRSDGEALGRGEKRDLGVGVMGLVNGMALMSIENSLETGHDRRTDRGGRFNGVSYNRLLFPRGV